MKKQLELAYAMNAFADHYLTDLYSAGHLRVPRKQLAAVVTPSDLGSLITRFMHDEDSKFGLNVSNGNGDRWHAYGDKRYFDAIDSANRTQVNQAVQVSADEVFAAYLSGITPSAGSFAALKKAARPASGTEPGRQFFFATVQGRGQQGVAAQGRQQLERHCHRGRLVGLEHLFAAQGLPTDRRAEFSGQCLIRRSLMTIKLKLELASGQSLKGAPLELLSKRRADCPGACG